MSGYNTILRFRRLEETVNRLGFMITAPKNGQWTDNHDAIGLKPKDAESLPIYSRDAELFCGSLEELEVWLRGVAWARDYDMILRMTDEKRRSKFEDAERARQAEMKKREEQKKMIEVLKSTDQQNRVAKK